MLISDKLILVELHKAGSARLKKLLGDLVGGETSAKQASYSDELAATGKPVLGYLCNPLTWYLAQWKMGCGGKGEFHKRLTDETKWDLLRSKRSQRTPTQEGAKPDAKALPEGWGAQRAKEFWYADDQNPEAFREWLQAVAAHRGLRRLVDHGYNNSPVARLGGLMTYQFFLTFVRNAENMEKSVDSMDALKALYRSQAITSHFIRSEAISADLLKALGDIGVALSDEQRAAVEALKERAGSEEAAILRFYDAASLRLVAKREAFLNELFGYAAPSAEARAAHKASKKQAGAKAGPAGEGPQLSKEEKEQKRQARAERQAAKAAKAVKAGAQPGGAGKAKARPAEGAGSHPAKAEKKAAKSGAAQARPEKLQRVKNRPAGADVVDTDDE